MTTVPPHTPAGAAVGRTRDRTPEELGGAVVLALRPRSTLIRDGAVSMLALTLPILGAMFWIDLPGQVWLLVTMLGIIVLMLGLGLARRLSRAGLWVTEEEVAARGCFGGLDRIPLDRLATVVAIQPDAGFERRGVDHLFALGHDGQLLLRMHGHVWSRTAMQGLAEQLGVPATVIDDVDLGMHFMRNHPELLYWFERRPLLARLLTGTAAVSSVLLALLLFELLT